jgi:hypothetical protein
MAQGERMKETITLPARKPYASVTALESTIDQQRRTITQLRAYQKRIEDGINRLVVEKKAAIGDRNELLILARDLLDQLVSVDGVKRDQVSTRDGRLAIDILQPYE